MFHSTEELAAHVRLKLAQGKPESALGLIRDFVELICLDERFTARVFSSALLDELCQEIGRISLQTLMANKTGAPTSQNTVVYIATKLYMAGGHSAVLEDFIHAQPELGHIVFVTGIAGSPERTLVGKRFTRSNVKLLWVPSGGLMEKLLWVQGKLLEISPEKVFLFNHHEDVVAIAAVQPQLQKHLYYYHHADHQLALGVHLPHAVHIDIHNMGYFNCREAQHKADNFYLPLTIADQGERPRELQFMETGQLVTCAVGGQRKFEAPYRYSYAVLVPEILVGPVGKHIHIGPLSTATLQKIRGELEVRGIAQTQFIHIPWTANVWRALWEHRVDVYLVSFPYCGARAIVEAMGSSTPVIAHQNYHNSFLSGIDMLYPSAYAWSNPGDLLAHLGELTPDRLVEEGKLARAHYETHHHPALLQRALDNDFTSPVAQPIPLRKYVPDQLQCCLDEFDGWHLYMARVRQLTKRVYWALPEKMRQMIFNKMAK